jgi:hypothetical protein
MGISQHLPSGPRDDRTGSTLEALSGTDVTVSVCSSYRVQTCAWLNAETGHVEGFNPERVQTVPDSISNLRSSRRACFQQFLQLAGVENVSTRSRMTFSPSPLSVAPLHQHWGDCWQVDRYCPGNRSARKFWFWCSIQRKWRRRRSLFRSQPQSSHRASTSPFLPPTRGPVYIADLLKTAISLIEGRQSGVNECNRDFATVELGDRVCAGQSLLSD